MALALLFTALLLLSLPFILILKHSKSTKVNPPLPPGPKPWPILGNLLETMGKKPHLVLAHLAKVHGPLISLRLGTQLLIVGSSSAAATEIVKTHDRELSGRHIPDVLMTTFGTHPELNRLAWADLTDEWRSFRALMKANLFSPKMVDNQSCIREKKVGEMLEYLGTEQGEVIQIRDAIFVFIFNSLANSYFSRDLVTFDGEETENVSKLIKETMKLWSSPNISDLYPLLSFLDLQGLRNKSNECVRKLRLIWDGYIRDRRSTKLGAPVSDFLDVLIQSGFSDEQISYVFVEILGGVSDSSISTIEWGMAELIKNPEQMKKLRKELEEAIPAGKMVKESDLTNLPYLHACVKETLRLHPPAPLIQRRATESCQVMNYTIPKDSQLLVNVWAIARDPSVWEDPLNFKPERFIVNSELDYKGNNFEYLPFGGGRRICAGMAVATRQVELALASLFLNFEWSLPNNVPPRDLDMDESFSLTMMKEQPLELIPKQRK
ncbi:Cytochrome P450 [Corchorus capsularis]|uniref:Cytochrome P450 n=1 Tax=Corchorus capsularis TaxID=210143 RepID=A0A1R3HW61_COCAP|nr:Cytochrome P450 [Corchorus capsularis]